MNWLSYTATNKPLDIIIDKATVTLEGAASLGGTITLAATNNPTLNIGSEDAPATVAINKLVGNTGAKINVGNADKAGSLTVANAALAGSTIFADPTWSGATPLIGSDVTLKSFGTGATANVIDGWLMAGSNSRFSVNTNSHQYLLDIVKTLGDRWNGNTATGINAAFGIFNPIKLDVTYGIYVDQTLVEGDTLPSTAATVSLANNSLLAVDMTNVGNTAATAALVNTEDLTTRAIA